MVNNFSERNENSFDERKRPVIHVIEGVLYGNEETVTSDVI